MQPVEFIAWWRAPVDRLRLKMATELLLNDVAYTLRPSALTATELGPSRPVALAHPGAPPAAMHPERPAACVSFPVAGSRLNTAIASLVEEAT
jgi:hypothetical protein